MKIRKKYMFFAASLYGAQISEHDPSKFVQIEKIGSC